MRPAVVAPVGLALSSVGASVQAPPSLPRFDRAVLLDPAPDTSANASVGDVNGDHLLAKGRHWPGVDRVSVLCLASP